MRQLIYILYLVVFCSSLFAQNTSDLESQYPTQSGNEAVKTLTKLIEIYTSTKRIGDAVRLKAKGESVISSDKVELSVRASFYRAVALAYFRDTNYYKSVDYFEKSISAGYIDQSQIYCEYAEALRGKDDISTAADAYRKAMKIAEAQNDLQTASRTYMALSQIYADMKRYPDAMEFMKKMSYIQKKSDEQRLLEKEKFIESQRELEVLKRKAAEADKNKAQQQVSEQGKKISNLQVDKHKIEQEASKLKDLTQEQRDSINLKDEQVKQKSVEVDSEKEKVKTREKYILWVSLGALVILLLLGVSVKLFLKTRRQNDVLQQLNKQIMAQYKKIEEQKIELANSIDQLNTTNHTLELTNVELESFTDILINQADQIEASLQYAKRMQTAVITDETTCDNLLKRYFIYMKPRNVVSGDFFYVLNHNDLLYVIIADCTGHGVPGAFMSILTVSLLKDIIITKGVNRSNEIFNRLRDNIIRSLSQSSEKDSKDGMDGVCLIIDCKKQTIEYTGANNPLYWFHNGELNILKPDKMPVSMHLRMDPFSSETIHYNLGDMIYGFSDGFQDQFGGEKDKKFGIKRFNELLTGMHDKSMIDQKEILESTYTNWLKRSKQEKEIRGRSKSKQTDDILVMGIRMS